MIDNYLFTRGMSSILISMPHSGVEIPDAILSGLTDAAKKLPDTDWHIPQLYNFVFEQGHNVLQATMSRYVVDLNRPPSNESLYPKQAGTGLCPTTLFNGDSLYLAGRNLGQNELASRIQTYWQPYHDKLQSVLAAIKSVYGYAILFDAHSINSRVPRLFEGQLPDLNLGTFNGDSCSIDIQNSIVTVLDDSEFSSVVNGRFRGGYITRHYGDPDNNIHAVQLEIAQCCYMEEDGSYRYDEERSAPLRKVLQTIFQTITSTL